jgi:hypothetical protein
MPVPVVTCEGHPSEARRRYAPEHLGPRDCRPDERATVGLHDRGASRARNSASAPLPTLEPESETITEINVAETTISGRRREWILMALPRSVHAQRRSAVPTIPPGDPLLSRSAP